MGSRSHPVDSLLLFSIGPSHGTGLATSCPIGGAENLIYVDRNGHGNILGNGHLLGSRMSTAHAPSSLFEEIATLFASAPSPQEIIEFQPSEAIIARASKLLQLNRDGDLDEFAQRELNQF